MTQFTMCYCPCHGHAPHCPCCQSCPLSRAPCVTPITCAVVMHIVARTLRCPHPSLPTPFIAHTLHCLHPSLPVLCVTPLIAHVVCHTHCPCHGHAPRCMHRVLCPSLHAPCVVPVACAVVMHLITCAM